ncbi:MAG: class II fumarate hydratase [Pseudomonadota bacterium]
MTDQKFRIEKDSMGELEVPESAHWGAQTQRAINNFQISGRPMPGLFIEALARVKWAAAGANGELGLLPSNTAAAIQQTAIEIAEGAHREHFPIDVFQTGSGTSSNMNANEVIAKLASEASGVSVHPNDDVNMSQSSNDVIPTSIHVSAALGVTRQLLPALDQLAKTIAEKRESVDDVVKTGRTHLMDAMPVRMSQELGAWESQITNAAARIRDTLPRVLRLAQGGTAVGSGINAHPKFGAKVATLLAEQTELEFASADSLFEALSCQDTMVELSGQLKVAAVAIMKIANDLRWMNSGPLAGLGEIALPALQPGSSIMPGKVNPVIPEAAAMVAAQVIGNDSCITVAGQAGNFQLNVMLPVIARNVLESIEILANVSVALGDKAIAGFTVNHDNLQTALGRNPILVTALNPVIGYELGAKVAKQAYAEGRPVKDVALELTDLTSEELDRLLDPAGLTEGGIRH